MNNETEVHLFLGEYPRCQMCGVRSYLLRPEQILTDADKFNITENNCVNNDLKVLCQENKHD
mgnify:FL=1